MLLVCSLCDLRQELLLVLVFAMALPVAIGEEWNSALAPESCLELAFSDHICHAVSCTFLTSAPVGCWNLNLCCQATSITRCDLVRLLIWAEHQAIGVLPAVLPNCLGLIIKNVCYRQMCKSDYDWKYSSPKAHLPSKSLRLHRHDLCQCLEQITQQDPIRSSAMSTAEKN